MNQPPSRSLQDSTDCAAEAGDGGGVVGGVGRGSSSSAGGVGGARQAGRVRGMDRWSWGLLIGGASLLAGSGYAYFSVMPAARAEAGAADVVEAERVGAERSGESMSSSHRAGRPGGEAVTASGEAAATGEAMATATVTVTATGDSADHERSEVSAAGEFEDGHLDTVSPPGWAGSADGRLAPSLRTRRGQAAAAVQGQQNGEGGVEDLESAVAEAARSTPGPGASAAPRSRIRAAARRGVTAWPTSTTSPATEAASPRAVEADAVPEAEAEPESDQPAAQAPAAPDPSATPTGRPAAPPTEPEPDAAPAPSPEDPRVAADERYEREVQRFVSFYNIGWSANSPRHRNIGWNVATRGWANFVRFHIQPQIDFGVRRFQLHNPFGDIAGEVMQLDQYQHAREAGLLPVVNGFVEAWKPITQQGIEVIGYVGCGMHDPDFDDLELEAWIQRAFESVQPMLDAGMSIGLDAAIFAGPDSPTHVFAQRLRDRGVRVYIEAKPTRDTPHWFDYPVILLDPMWIYSALGTGDPAAQRYAIDDSLLSGEIVRMVRPREGETHEDLDELSEIKARIRDILDDGHTVSVGALGWLQESGSLRELLRPDLQQASFD